MFNAFQAGRLYASESCPLAQVDLLSVLGDDWYIQFTKGIESEWLVENETDMVI